MFCMTVRALAFRYPFRQVALAGLCLPILSEPCFLFVE
jgi:hypothetical protein